MSFLGSLFGDGGSSSSTASTSNTTTNQTDRRIVNDSGLVLQGEGHAFNSSSWAQDNSTKTTNITDGGIAKGAFDVVTANQKVVGASISDLLSGATKIFTTQSNAQADSFANLTSATTKANSDGLAAAYQGFGALVTGANKVLEGNARSTENLGNTIAAAYQSATAEKSGSLDNKTIAILGALAAFAFFMSKR